MDSFCIKFTYLFEKEELTSIFCDLGNVGEIKSRFYDNEDGYDYTIYMKSWTAKGEKFRNELLENGTNRYCYDNDGHKGLYFICEP